VSSRARGAWLCAVILLAWCAAPALASAELVLAPGDTTLRIIDKAGEPDSRAGAHPDRLVQGFKFTNTSSPEFARDMVTDLPVGLSGNPNAVPLCPRSQIDTIFGFCPPESQVGTLKTDESVLPLFSVEPGPNQAAVFAGNPFFPVAFVGQLRSADQGLSLHLDSIGHSPYFALSEGELELWGVPADHQVGTSIPRKPLLTMPTRCGGAAPAVNIRMHTWEHPERWGSGSGDSGWPVSGCEALGFDPDVAIALDNAVADTPTGAAIDLTIPQNESPDGRATSQVKDVDILLPEGMTISPGGAAGLGTCSDAQLGLGGDADPTCPGPSRVGSVELSVASLSKPLRGSIYLGTERPGERFRLFAVAAGPGTLLKFPASLRADPKTGRLTTTLANLPQASFGRLSLRFDGGPNALLATPLGCGRAATAATVTPYSGNKADEWTGAVSIAAPAGRACAGSLPFGPSFSGGSTNAVAGHATAFTTTIRRGDGEQLPERLTVAFPPGVSAALGKVEPCPEAAIAALRCPASSRLGSTVAELGPGTSPARMSGEIFFTGPYKRAPYGLAMVFGAKIGPFDLGNLVVRGSLRVDSLSGQVSAAMDSLPTILEGIPIRFQTIGLDLDRAGFMHNPTSCAPSAVTTALRSSAGASARPSSPFSVHGCIDLPFRPAFSMALNGSDELRREGKPGLRIGAKIPTGNANLRGADIAFPKILALDANGVRAICARRAAEQGRCPGNSRVGTGFARTDLLKAPMKGSIYAVQPRGSGSPDLWTSLDGEGLQVSLRAETAVEHGRAETKLVGLPDFPLRSFTMALAGGERGLFKLKQDPCGAHGKLVAPMEIAGQNGARASLRPAVGVPRNCGNG
jgi:hypothetical protein